MKEKAHIMDKAAMTRALYRISHEIIEHNKGTENIALIGIQRRGVPIANLLAEHIGSVEKTVIPVGTLDITFYRDDLSMLSAHPVLNGTTIPFNINGRDLILVDDVLYTGRTTRAAMDAIMEVGRAASIQLAVLIDRGHREVPIRADYVGKNVPTSRSELVAVRIAPFDDVDEVVLLDKSEGER